MVAEMRVTSAQLPLTREEADVQLALDSYVQDAGHQPRTTVHGTASTEALPEIASQVLADAQASALGGEAAEAPGALGAFVRAARVLQAVYQRMNANTDFQGATSTIAASAANVAVRNLAAVFVPTALRQFLSYGIEAAMQRMHASDTARTIAGAAVPMLAVGALAVGAARDRSAGTNTPTSERSRLIMGAATAAAGVATVATGSMARAAPLMLAFTAYTAMRDLLVQSRLRLHNHNTDNYTPDATHFALISVGYGIDQALVDFAMSMRASPSGPAALRAGAGIQAGNAMARAGINWAGEVGEDLMFQGIEAMRSRLDPQRQSHALQLGIRDVGYERNNVLNGLMGPWAVRTGILSTTIGLTQILADRATNPSFAGNAALAAGASALIVGAVNAVLYEPFADAGSAQPAGRAAFAPREEHAEDAASVEANVESGGQQSVGSEPLPDRPTTPPGRSGAHAGRSESTGSLRTASSSESFQTAASSFNEEPQEAPPSPLPQ